MDVSKVKVKAKRRILKYEEGADEPFEVIERENIFTGEEAQQLLNEMGVIEGGNGNVVK